MIEFEKFIDSHPNLQDYFVEFPKRLMELAYQVIRSDFY
jgi:hypothetical protein